MNRSAADLRHHDLWSDGREAIEENGMFCVTGNDVEQKIVHVSGGVGMFAIPRLGMTVAEINTCVAGGASRLMAMSAVVI